MIDMEKILKQVSEKLINCFLGQTTLRFPKRRGATTRISEQESKFFFSIVFEHEECSFAVEVPTKETHIITGKKPRSALHDMAIYDEMDTLEFAWIIELKSGQPKESNIEKDFYKMVFAKCNCVWFHTLENANSGTIPALLDKFNNAWDNVKSSLTDIKEWKFTIVVLKQEKYYQITIRTDKTISFPNDISKWDCY
ncbi:MAG: hypothetical protein LBL31_08660 [Spirochaetaceae bacterium]|jgi:hypothetical protein|nr:hypothetical protein [Spirochaetaceae bacterium]